MDAKHIKDVFKQLGNSGRHNNSFSCGQFNEMQHLIATALIECDDRISKDNLVWLRQYDQVAKWLCNTEGKGLLLVGNCGVGKTLLGRYVIPAIFLAKLNKIVRWYHSKDSLNLDKAKEMESKRLLSIDDIGSETFASDYGQRRYVIHDIILQAEDLNKTLILTTNLNSEQLTDKYDLRAVDRLLSNFKVVNFGDQASLRR